MPDLHAPVYHKPTASTVFLIRFGDHRWTETESGGGPTGMLETLVYSSLGQNATCIGATPTAQH